MKFLKEIASRILIYKYRKSDLQFKENGIILMGADTKSALMRLPTFRGKKYFIYKNQIAEFDNYVFFPADQLENIEKEYLEYPKPVSQRYLTKMDWLNIKQQHPYKEHK